MKKTPLVIVLIIIFLSGCNYQLNQKESVNKDLKEKKEKKTSNLNIGNIEVLPNTIGWVGGGDFYLAFSPNEVHFIFNGTCAYWYPSIIIKNEIIFYWAKNEDCTFDRGLSKKFKNIKNPELGKPFGKIKLLNDSTLFIDYYYTDWVKKINIEESETIDTLFPSYIERVDICLK